MLKIESPRLFLRRFRPDDWIAFREYMAQPKVLEYESDWDTSPEGCQRAAASFSQGDQFWAVEEKETERMIGHVYFGQLEAPLYNTRELGYIFNPAYYGHGYATEACATVVQYGFERGGLHRVVAHCAPQNERSWKLLERLGMRKEGHCVRSVSLKKNALGELIWWDELTYAVLAEEWKPFPVSYHEI